MKEIYITLPAAGSFVENYYRLEGERKVSVFLFRQAKPRTVERAN